MPIYEYRCAECNQVFEEWQKGFEEQEVPCPVCSTPSRRIISNTSFILKGSGWYVTDYAAKKPSAGGNGNGNGNGNGKGNGASESKEGATSAEASPAKDSGSPPAKDSVKKEASAATPAKQGTASVST